MKPSNAKVEMVLRGGKTVKQAAEELGVNPFDQTKELMRRPTNIAR
jgi:transposase-like protein